MALEVTIHFRIVAGKELPKTNLLAEIDPFVRFRHNGQQFQTSIQKSQPSPTWQNEDYFLPVTQTEDGALEGELLLELWDKETFGEKLCGHSVLDLSQYDWEHLENIELPVEYVDAYREKWRKQQRNSRLVVSVLGCILSHKSMAEQLCEWPGFLRTDDSVYVLASKSRRMYAAVEYNSKYVAYKLCVTKKNNSQHPDILYMGQEPVRVIRRCYEKGRIIVPGMPSVHEEVILRDLPFTADFNQVYFSVQARTVLSTTSTASLLSKAKFGGLGMSFEQATKEMSRAMVDMELRAAFVAVDDASPPNVLLMLDYGSGAAAAAGRAANVPLLKLCLVNPEDSGLAYEFVSIHPEHESTTEVHSAPKPVLGGKYEVLKSTVLTTTQCPELILESGVVTYEVGKYSDWTLEQLLNPRGVYEDPEKPEPEHNVLYYAQGVATQVKGTVTKVGDVVGGVVGGAVGGVVGGMVGGINGVVGGAKDGGRKVAGTIAQGVGTVATTVAGGVGAGVGTAIKGGQGIGKTLKKNVINKVFSPKHMKHGKSRQKEYEEQEEDWDEDYIGR